MAPRVTTWVIAAGMSVLLAGSALAQAQAPAQAPAAKKADCTVKLTEGAVAVGIGWSWGKGVLTCKGKEYPFKVEGLSVLEVGVKKAAATGEVYNLTKLEDFGGVYRTAAIEGTLVKGKGATALQNAAGVSLQLKSSTKGANLKLGTDGLKLTLEQ
jgi:hypothetical protein